MKITSNVSKNALLQMFNQLPATRSNDPSIPENSSSSVTQNLVNYSEALDTQINNNLRQENSNDVTSLGLMAAMQQTITSLQCTVNKLIDNNQPSSTGQSCQNTGILQKVYQSGAQAQPTPSLPTRQGVPAHDLPHIDVLSDTVRRNIRPKRLFISHQDSYEKEISVDTISMWSLQTIKLAHSENNVDQVPISINAHEVRAIASSWAWSHKVPLDDVVKVGFWSSENSFIRFYLRDMSVLASSLDLIGHVVAAQAVVVPATTNM